MASAVIDVALGPVMQRFLGNARTAGQAQLLGALVSAATLLTFFAGVWVSPDIRFVYALLSGIAFRLSFAAYDIPQNALMSLATADAMARSRVASTRIWFSGTATLIVAAAVGPLVARRDDFDGASLIFYIMIAFSAVAIVSSALLMHVLRHQTVAGSSDWRVEPMPSRPTPMSAEFAILLCVMFVTSAFTPLFSKLEPYYASYGLRSSWWGGAIIIAMAIGIFAGQPLWLRLCSTFSRSRVLAHAAILQIAALATFGLGVSYVPLLGVFAAFCFGLGNGGVGLIQWAAFSDAAARRGSHRVGFSFGLFTATGKVGFAAGGLVLGTVLEKADFRGGDNWVLTAVMTAVPTLGAALCLLAANQLTRIEKKPLLASV